MTDKKFSRPNLLINLIIAASVLITGIVLLSLNLNESFWSNNTTIVQIFDIITKIGDEELYIVFFAIFYFGIDKKFAKRQMLGFAIALHLTDFGKSLFQDPRPFTNGLLVEEAEGFGFPSGHSSGTLSFWGYALIDLKGEEKKKGLPWRIFALFSIIMVPISRLIIGVHDLQDVIGGSVLGLVVISLYLYYEPKVSKMLESWPTKKKIITGVGISVGLWVLSSLLLYLVNVVTFDNIADGIHYFKVEAIQVMGLSCAIGTACSIAFPLEEKYVKYDPRQLIWWKKLIAIVIGFVITFGFFLGSDILFDLFPDIYFITRFFKYAIMILIAGFAGPWLLEKIFKTQQ